MSVKKDEVHLISTYYLNIYMICKAVNKVDGAKHVNIEDKWFP